MINNPALGQNPLRVGTSVHPSYPQNFLTSSFITTKAHLTFFFRILYADKIPDSRKHAPLGPAALPARGLGRVYGRGGP
ncbi:4398_t:CDS:2 [Rhizophagus irregularis]|nr:4398_t:CDS:2 [Rhizophagus irregularis]